MGTDVRAYIPYGVDKEFVCKIVALSLGSGWKRTNFTTGAFDEGAWALTVPSLEFSVLNMKSIFPSYVQVQFVDVAKKKRFFDMFDRLDTESLPGFSAPSTCLWIAAARRVVETVGGKLVPKDTDSKIALSVRQSDSVFSKRDWTMQESDEIFDKKRDFLASMPPLMLPELVAANEMAAYRHDICQEDAEMGIYVSMFLDLEKRRLMSEVAEKPKKNRDRAGI